MAKDTEGDVGASANTLNSRGQAAEKKSTMKDPTRSHLEKLDPHIRRRALIMLYAVRSAGIPLIITSSWRTPEEQRALIQAGRSWTENSRHLLGLAFDVDIYGWNRDDIPIEFWQILGPWAETALELTWGGHFKDYGHFEVNPPQIDLI